MHTGGPVGATLPREGGIQEVVDALSPTDNRDGQGAAAKTPERVSSSSIVQVALKTPGAAMGVAAGETGCSTGVAPCDQRPLGRRLAPAVQRSLAAGSPAHNKDPRLDTSQATGRLGNRICRCRGQQSGAGVSRSLWLRAASHARWPELRSFK